MGLLWFVIIGALAGWLAGQFMKGHGFGLLGDIIVGVIGAFIGRYISQSAGLGFGGGLIGTLIVAFLGAVILLFVVRLIAGGSRRRSWS
jgi:uncharacterized membrane protein YeaQ/YmgE (transglycosylase-associated protein family)